MSIDKAVYALAYSVDGGGVYPVNVQVRSVIQPGGYGFDRRRRIFLELDRLLFGFYKCSIGPEESLEVVGLAEWNDFMASDCVIASFMMTSEILECQRIYHDLSMNSFARGERAYCDRPTFLDAILSVVEKTLESVQPRGARTRLEGMRILEFSEDYGGLKTAQCRITCTHRRESVSS